MIIAAAIIDEKCINLRMVPADLMFIGLSMFMSVVTAFCPSLLSIGRIFIVIMVRNMYMVDLMEPGMQIIAIRVIKRFTQRPAR
jgi:hypothetical protein